MPKLNKISLFLTFIFIVCTSCEKKNSTTDTNEMYHVTYWGEIHGFGIAFTEKPQYIELKTDLCIDDLVNGGYVLLTRHTVRDPLEGHKLWALDRNGTAAIGASLNTQGIEDAKKINKLIYDLNIPISEVFASPTHRTKQLANIGFGSKDYTEKIELIYQPMMRIEEKALFDLELLKLLSVPIKGNGNRILTAHNNTLERLGIKGVPSTRLQQGDTAVIKPLGNFSFKYIGTIEIDEWRNYTKLK
jgi:hypothetical protein